MTGASGRPGEPLVGTAVPKAPGVSPPAPQPGPSRAPGWAEEPGPRQGGALLSLQAATLLSGGCGGEGGGTFTWRREDPGAPGVQTRARAAPMRLRGSSGNALRGSRRVRQRMLRSNHWGWRGCSSQVPASVAGAESLPGGKGTFLASNPELLPSNCERGPLGTRERREPLVSPGERSRPQPSPPHSPTRAGRPRARRGGYGRDPLA